jgi:hypothetical protein
MPFLLALLLAQAAPAKDLTIAIASVEARGGATAEQASEMNDALTAQLVADGRLRVVERQQIAKVMKEQALAQSGLMTDEVQIKLAQLVGARWIAVGAVQGSGKGLLLSLRAMDSNTAQVAFADTLKVGTHEQIDPGARQLARKMEQKLVGPISGAADGGQELVGDFDVGQVKEGAREVARSLASRFPRINGRIVDALPNGTVSCSFGEAQPFSGQFFQVTGKDEVTEHLVKKGFFVLTAISAGGCTGKVKAERGSAIGEDDVLASLPLKIDLEPFEGSSGVQSVLAKLFTDEVRAALKSYPQFVVGGGSQLKVTGRAAGPRGQRTVQLQVLDKAGTVVTQLEVQQTF